MSVRPVADSTRTVSAELDATGGSISATAADGTRFVLDLPPDALGGQTTVRMTPSAVEDFPLSKGFIGGVQLEPEGLILLVPATLTIKPGRIALRPDAVAFAYRGQGQEFALDVNTISSDAMTLQLLHFSGYGGGVPGPSDSLSQAFLDPLDALRQQAMQILERSRPTEDDEGNEVPPELTRAEVDALLSQLLIDAFNNYLPALDIMASDCDLATLQTVVEITIGTIRTARMTGHGEQSADRWVRRARPPILPSRS